MSDATDTMSVQLVLCVADSVWRAAGHLARVCCMPAAHSHRATRIIAPASMLLLLLAVLSFHCRHSHFRHRRRDRSWCCCGRFGGRSA